MKILKMFLPVLFVISVISNCFAEKAEKIDCPKNLWKGLIGETANQGYLGMYAAACAYRNDVLNGLPVVCVALKRKDLDEFISRQGRKYELRAKEIIRKIFEEGTPDITGGATHYENIEAFGPPSWESEMRVTTVIGSHTFFVKKIKPSCFYRVIASLLFQNERLVFLQFEIVSIYS